MWIRSQNKLFLGEVKRILILSPNMYRKKFEIVNYIALRPSGEQDSCEDYDTLGEYESKERALAIMDDIHKEINNTSHTLFIPKVFEMPKE